MVMTVSGILYMGAMLFYLRAIQTEEASVVAPLFQANTLFTFLLGLLLLHELPQLARSCWARAWWCWARSACRWTRACISAASSPGWCCLMLSATFVLALSSVVFKFFAVHDEFWATTFWTFVGEGLFGAAILAVPDYRQQFARLFRRNPGAVIGVNAANELINLGGGLGVRYASLLAPVGLVSAISATIDLLCLPVRHPADPVFPQVWEGGFVRPKRLSEGGGRAFDHGRGGPDRDSGRRHDALKPACPRGIRHVSLAP